MSHRPGDLHLTVHNGPHAGRTHLLSSDIITLGRHSSNQIVVDDLMVSRHHVRLVWQGNTFLLEDLGSANGTWVNEVRVTAPTPLRPGDIIRLGRHVQLAYGRQVQAPTAVPPSNNRSCLLLSLAGGIMALVILILAGAAGYLWLAGPDQPTPTGVASLPEYSPPLLQTAISTQAVAPATPEPTATATSKPRPGATTAPTAIPTLTVAPTSTVPPVAPKPPHDLLTFVDDFSNPDSGWEVVNKENRERYYEKGELIYWVKMRNWTTWSSGTLGIFSDFTFEAEARLVEGPAQARYGLMFWKLDNNNFYYFFIDGEGQYKVGKMKDGEWQQVEGRDWLPSSYIGPGKATNRLKVVATGPHMSFYVNDHYLTTVEDGDLRAGQIGLIADAPREVESFKAAFDNARAYIPNPRPSVVPDPPHTELLYRSDFSNTAGWDEKSIENYDIFSDNGRYLFLLKGSKFTAGSWNIERLFSDFTLEADIQLLEDASGANAKTELGLIFRLQDSGNSYFFVITDSGDYIVHKWVNGESAKIGGSQSILMASPHINMGQSTNHLKVVAAGPEISFYVNGQYLLTITDDSFERGYIGLVAGRKSGAGVTQVAFENLEVYGSEQAKAAAPPPPPQPAISQPQVKSGLNKIAFASNRDGNQEIYVMNADGSGVTRLTDNPAEDHSPVWSPDGGTIAFVSNRNGNAEIYLMAADGRGQTNLTENPAEDYDPAWAGNGARLAFTTSRDDPIRTDIWVMNFDGSGQTKLRNFGVSPAWSPDNSRIAGVFRFGGLTHLGVMPADASAEPQPLLQMGLSNFPAWSPDGRRLAFENAESPENSEILVINADGSNLVNLTNNRDIIDLYPTWSPDGSRLAFVSDRDGNQEIYVMGADGSGVQRLTNHAAWDGQPNWSP